MKGCLFLLLAFFFIILGIKADNDYIINIGGAILFVLILPFTLHATNGHVAKNDNDKTWIKSRRTEIPEHLPKGEKANDIYVVVTQKGVFRVPNATSVKIDAEGNIEFTFISCLTNKILALDGGYKNKCFAEENPDWQPLFEKQLEINQLQK